MEHPLMWLLLAWNVCVFGLYGVDKRRARSVRPRSRVPERTLLVALFLAAPAGAWLGMRLFRHKTRKQSFRWRAIALTIVDPLWPLLWWSAGTA